MSESQDARYSEAVAAFGGALERLAIATELNRERRRDLLQDMHVALWRSFASYDHRCSVRTWVYRIAHNVAASYVRKERRANHGLVMFDDVEHGATASIDHEIENDQALSRLRTLIRQLKAPDRQIITLYLEDLDAASIAEIVGLSPAAVATRISRLKSSLAQHFHQPVRVRSS